MKRTWKPQWTCRRWGHVTRRTRYGPSRCKRCGMLPLTLERSKRIMRKAIEAMCKPDRRPDPFLAALAQRKPGDGLHVQRVYPSPAPAVWTGGPPIVKASRASLLACYGRRPKGAR